MESLRVKDWPKISCNILIYNVYSINLPLTARAGIGDFVGGRRSRYGFRNPVPDTVEELGRNNLNALRQNGDNTQHTTSSTGL